MTSALYKDWVVNGLGDLEPEALEELRGRISEKQPARYLPRMKVSYNPSIGLFYLEDSHGFLCATQNIEALIMLLVAEGRPDGSAASLLKIKRTGDHIPPLTDAVEQLGATEQWSPPPSPPAEIAPDADPDVKSRARALADRMRDRMAAGPRGKPGSGTDLTIEDGTQIKTEGQ